MRAEIKKIHEMMEAADYVTDPAIATSVHLAMTLKKPLLIEGHAGVGKTEVAKVMARMLGVHLIRLQCYEGLDAAQALYEWNYPKQLLHIKLEENTPHTMSEKEAAAAASHQRDRRAARAADRRDRPGRRGVRSLPSRSALRLPGDHSGSRHDQGNPAALCHPHVEPRSRAVGRAAPPLPLPVDRLSRLREGSEDRHAESPRGQRAPGGGDLALHGDDADAPAGQDAGRRRDARLGAGAVLAARRPPRRGAGDGDARLRRQGRR